MAFTFIAVLACMVGLIGAETFTYKGCSFPKIDRKQSQSTRTTMDRITHLLNKTFQVQAGNYTYKFAVCSHVSADKGHQGDMTIGLVQTGSSFEKDPIIGSITDTDIKGGTNWLMLEYGNGSNYNHFQDCSKEKRHALIMISCMWGEKEGIFKFVEENKDKSSGCYYLFDLAHEAACTPVPKKLSTGSILLIVVASVVGVYLLVGVIYQRVTSGAKGIDQVPNLGFWLNFGSLTADGCDLVCRCKGQSGSSVYRPVDVIGGTAPDSMGSGQEVDEHLLPM